MIPVDAPALLRGAGLRVTAPRVAILETLASRPHSSADAVHTAVGSGAGGQASEVTLQTVYNVLHDLAEHGLARRIEPADHPARFELRVGDNHHHVVCTRCGEIADVDCVVGHAPCLTPSTTHGFTLTEAEVTFWGVCAACSEASSPAIPH